MTASPKKISFAQLGAMLQHAWQQGKLGDDVHRAIQAGFLPIAELRDKLRWIIERDGDGLKLMVEDETN
jgi:hypothetical protein